MTSEPTETPEVPESPATWENVVVGEIKEAVGHVLGNDELIEEGEDQKEVAREIRKEWEDEHRG